jgi:hypothetical protein
MKYVIQDQDTGNYVTSDSVFETDKGVLYSTFTGRSNGIEYSDNKELANNISTNITNQLAKYEIHKNYIIKDVTKSTLPKGEMLIEHIY